ncbi:MAG TPA: hypothetical protein EYQ00_08390 [Dehalococcoidia bacterium]|jgi:hypothetical protein|nr:hypothetical protein [Dehalococcoidia bacterium]
MKVGDVVRLRKSHPAVKRWRQQNQLRRQLNGSGLFIGQWAEDGELLLLLEKCGYSDGRWDVLGPGGQLASFDDYLFTTWGVK